MFELAGRAPILFPAHMVSSALALLLAPVVIMLRHRPELHKPLGRLLGGFVVIGGLTALPVAVMSHSTPWARAGFFVQGLVWLYLLGAAYAAIRARDIQRHAKLMIAMVAVTTGAVWFRVLTGSGDCAQSAIRAGLCAVSLAWLDGAACVRAVETAARRDCVGTIAAVSPLVDPASIV